MGAFLVFLHFIITRESDEFFKIKRVPVYDFRNLADPALDLFRCSLRLALRVLDDRLKTLALLDQILLCELTFIV